MKKKLTVLLIAAGLLACLMLYTYYAREKQPGVDAKTDISFVKSALKKAKRTGNPNRSIKYLRTAYVIAEQLETNWPDSEKVPVFLEKYEEKLDSIPGDVYRLSIQARDLDSFKWAGARSDRTDIQYEDILKIWQMGRQWRDYYMSEYPDKSLSIFMSKAVDTSNEKFFNQYIGAFKADGYRLEFPLEKTEFNARFCHFFAEMIAAAMQQEDTKRIGFLLDHMPPSDSVTHIDPLTKRTLKELGDYVCYELKDEALACQLVDLGYEMNRVDVAKTGFGRDFAEALLADLEHAVTHVLKLNEWHAPLSIQETRFLLILPDPELRLVHKRHIDEAIETSIMSKSAKNTKNALRLIKFREEIQPLTLYDYDQFLGWSLEYNNRAVFNYVKTKCTEIDIYRISLTDLAGNQTLFRLHAPKILEKIYKTMDRKPREDGTTLGRIDDLLTSHNPEAVLYVVEKYDFEDEWMDVSPDGRTVLMSVCEGGNLDAAKYLIENKGADIDATTDYFEVTTTLFGRARSGEGKLSPIFFAAKSGNSELIVYLASKGASVNSRSGLGATPLMYAVSENNLEATKMLISLGAYVNAIMTKNPSDLEDEGGQSLSTAYRRALLTGNKEILNVLVKAGATP